MATSNSRSKVPTQQTSDETSTNHKEKLRRKGKEKGRQPVQKLKLPNSVKRGKQKPTPPPAAAEPSDKKKKQRPPKDKVLSGGGAKQRGKNKAAAKKPRQPKSPVQGKPSRPAPAAGLPKYTPPPQQQRRPPPMEAAQPLALKEPDTPMSLFRTVRLAAPKPTGLSADVMDKQRQLRPEKLEPMRQQMDRHARAIDDLKRKSDVADVPVCTTSRQPIVPFAVDPIRAVPVHPPCRVTTAPTTSTVTIRFTTTTSRPTLLDLAGTNPSIKAPRQRSQFVGKRRSRDNEKTQKQSSDYLVTPKR